MNEPKRLRWVLLVAASCLIGGTLAAQTTDEINSGIQLNFTPPGARSLGMGGAFVAVATDATAAVSNPAGLTQLTQSEISIEVLASEFNHTFVDRGHSFGEPTGNGLDTIAGLVDGEASDQTFGASYVSAVLRKEGTEDTPVAWTLAAYRHELANFKASYRRQGPFNGPFTLPDGSLWPRNGQPGRTRPTIMNMDLQIDSYGIAGAYKLAEGLSLGISVAINDFSIDSATRRYSTKGGRLYQPADYSPENLRVTQVQQGSDIGFSLSAGYLWWLNDRVTMGGVVRLGPSFDYTARRVLGPQAGPDDVPLETQATFNVPDLIGFGFAYKVPNTCRARKDEDCLTVAFEWDRVEYSKLTDEITDPFDSSGPETLDTLAGRGDSISIEDGSEYHLGVEYEFLKSLVSLRAGAWYDPEHRFAIRDPQTAADRRASVIFRPGDAETHYSFGAGKVFEKKPNSTRPAYHIDAAIDFADAITVFTISTVVRF